MTGPQATLRSPKLPPLRVCPHHGQSFRSWNAGARGPCCRAEDATFGVEPVPYSWELPDYRPAYVASPGTRVVTATEIKARRVARGAFTVEPV